MKGMLIEDFSVVTPVRKCLLFVFQFCLRSVCQILKIHNQGKPEFKICYVY